MLGRLDRAWHGVWVRLEGAAGGVEEAGGHGTGCGWGWTERGRWCGWGHRTEGPTLCPRLQERIGTYDSIYEAAL